MSNDKRSRGADIPLVAIVFKFMRIHEDYREITTTIKLYLYDIYINVINMIKDGIAYTGIPYLGDSLISAAKCCCSYYQEQGCSLLKLNARYPIKKLTLLPVALHLGLPIRRERRATLRKI